MEDFEKAPETVQEVLQGDYRNLWIMRLQE